jgi:arylsulfatase A-like enzyme
MKLDNRGNPADGDRLPPKHRSACIALFAAMMALSSAACSRPAADNILFVSFDTTRADRISSYGYSQPTTPNVDALAAEGVLFERAFSHVPSTLPAHTSMLTGLLPPRHGVRCNGWYQVPEEHETLAETLAGAGFATGAVIGAFPLDSRFGLAQGFSHYDARFTSGSEQADRPEGLLDAPGRWLSHDYTDFERSAKEVSDRAIEWLRAHGNDDRRWFLFAHYFDPHWPYEPTAEWSGRFAETYDAELAYADHHLGRLLEFADTLPGRTLVVFTSDHGESLGEHGEEWHNRYLYNSTLHVPLIMRLRGEIPGGTRVRSNVSHIDLHPTVLELLGIQGPSGGDGRSLATAARGGVHAGADIYAETLVWKLEVPHGISVRALVREDLKWVRTDREPPSPVIGVRQELYDMAADPAELVNLAASVPNVLAATMSEDLAEWSAALEEQAYAPERMVLDEETKAKLRSLGYLGN